MSELQRSITILPAYDKQAEDCGIHGADIRFTLGNEQGFVSWRLFTCWLLPQNRATHTIDKYPFEYWRSPAPAGFDYHSNSPQFEGHISTKCDLLPSGECYSDGTACTEDLFELLISQGTDGLWAELESRWQTLFSTEELLP